MWCLSDKIDSLGNEIWSKTFGEDNCGDVGHCVKQTSDGGYIITGYTYIYKQGEYNYYLVEIDPEQGSVIDEKNQNEYSVYCCPNPTTGIFTIQEKNNLSDNLRIKSVEITNVNGQIIKQLLIDNNQFKRADKRNLFYNNSNR